MRPSTYHLSVWIARLLDIVGCDMSRAKMVWRTWFSVWDFEHVWTNPPRSKSWLSMWNLAGTPHIWWEEPRIFDGKNHEWTERSMVKHVDFPSTHCNIMAVSDCFVSRYVEMYKVSLIFRCLILSDFPRFSVGVDQLPWQDVRSVVMPYAHQAAGPGSDAFNKRSSYAWFNYDT